LFKKGIFTICAALFLLLGFLGAILPGIPSLMFLLIGVWFLANVDKRIVVWLYSLPVWHHFVGLNSRLPKASFATSLGMKLAYIGFAWASFISSLIITDLIWINILMFTSALFSTAMTFIPSGKMFSLNSLEEYRRGNI
jgi:uncharacterized membrane protein YbaN (DUF454 family)